MACDVNTPLMNVAQVIQLKANVKFDYPIEIFYNSHTQMGVTKQLSDNLNNQFFFKDKYNKVNNNE